MKKDTKLKISGIVLMVLLCFSRTLLADEVMAAIAANFTDVTKELTPLFKKETGHTLTASFGATGKLAEQIKHGAPFQVLLAADTKVPKMLEEEGHAIAGSRFVYAVGKLVLWSPSLAVEEGQAILTKLEHLAIANPKTAPYGAAAEQTIQRLKLTEALTPKLVMGENISQTFEFSVTGNAPAAFVSLAQIKALPDSKKGSYWLVPTDLYDPIEQSAVLTQKGKESAAAKAFLTFLQSKQAKAVIQRFGYEFR